MDNFRRFAGLCGLAAFLMIGIGLLGRHHTALDSSAHFRMHLGVAAAAIAVALLLLRGFVIAFPSLGAVVVHSGGWGTPHRWIK